MNAILDAIKNLTHLSHAILFMIFIFTLYAILFMIFIFTLYAIVLGWLVFEFNRELKNAILSAKNKN